MIERKYYDLHIVPKSFDDLLEMVAMAKYMGYSGIGVVVDNLEGDLGDVLSFLEKMEKKFGLHILIKVDVKMVKSMKSVKFDPLKTLYYRNVESEKEFRGQLKRENINVLTVPIDKLGEVLNVNTLHLLKQTEKALEVTLKKLWLSNPVELQRTIKTIQKTIWLLNKKVNIYVASGAEKPSEMRNPRAIRSILKILDVKDWRTIEMLSTIPQNIIKITKPIIIIDKAEENAEKR